MTAVTLNAHVLATDVLATVTLRDRENRALWSGRSTTLQGAVQSARAAGVDVSLALMADIDVDADPRLEGLPRGWRVPVPRVREA